MAEGDTVSVILPSCSHLPQNLTHIFSRGTLQIVDRGNGSVGKVLLE